MKQLKRILTIFSVNILLLGAGLVIIELIFGAWFDTSNLNRLNLLKDCVLQFDVSHLYNDPEPIIQYSRDKYGLRGTYDRPSSIDILTVGGSTTDQRYIRDGETWQDVLQKQFARTGKTVIVANAGVDGQSTYGHIKNFEWWFPHIPGLRPAYILFYVGLNDFYKESGYRYDQLMNGVSLKRRIKDNSAVWYIIRTLYGEYEAIIVSKIGHRSIDFSKVQWTHDRIQNDYKFMDVRLNEYANRLRVLADMTHNLGARAIFMSQPAHKYRITPDGLTGDSVVDSYDGYKYNGVDYYYMIRKLNGVTKAVANEENALFVDMANHTWGDADFYDFAHMTPQGAKKVGLFLWGALKNVINIAEQGAALDGDSTTHHPRQ